MPLSQMQSAAPVDVFYILILVSSGSVLVQEKIVSACKEKAQCRCAYLPARRKGSCLIRLS